MDAKVTLSFNEEVILKAKRFAEKKNISLSRLTEHLLRKVTSGYHTDLEDLPVSDWVNAVAEGQAEYITKPRKRAQIREEYLNRKK